MMLDRIKTSIEKKPPVRATLTWRERDRAGAIRPAIVWGGI
jgi:hypothetical protein